MTGPASILSLTALSGVPLLSQAATVVGVPDPAPLIEANTKADTKELKERAEDWEELAKAIVEHRQSLESDAVLIRSGWSGAAAEGFYRYTHDLLKVLDEQESVAKEISTALSDIAGALEDCKRDTNEVWATAVWMVATEVLMCRFSLLAAGVTGPLGVAGLVAAAVVALIAILLNLIGALIVISNKQGKLRLALAVKLKALVEVSSTNGLKDIAIPESPAIVTKGFSTFTFHPDGYPVK